MYHIRLVKGLSYTGIVSATKEHPDVYIEDDAVAEAVLATGYFTTVSAGPKTLEVTPDEAEFAYGGKTLDEMNISELETFAAYKNVSLIGIGRKKADILKKLRKELPAEELEGEIRYGSPTMTEIQE